MRRGRVQCCAPGRAGDRPSAGNWGKRGEQLWPLCQGSRPGPDRKWGWAGGWGSGSTHCPLRHSGAPPQEAPPGPLRGRGRGQSRGGGQSLPSPRLPGSAPSIRCQGGAGQRWGTRPQPGRGRDLGLCGPRTQQPAGAPFLGSSLGPDSCRSPPPPDDGTRLCPGCCTLSRQGCKLWSLHPHLRGHRKSGRRHRCLGGNAQTPQGLWSTAPTRPGVIGRWAPADMAPPPPGKAEPSGKPRQPWCMPGSSCT